MTAQIDAEGGAAPAPPLATVIVVSFNTREMTLDCLRSLRAETTAAHELIVVDNASQDGSAEAIAAEFPEATMMAEAENHGFAKANNLAAERARGEYLLLLNPDTVVLDGAVDKLLAFATANPGARIWGGRTLDADWRALGGFDLSYVMYGEEADLCHRARAFGARPRVTPEAEIVHYGGASETVRADKLVRLLTAKMTLTRRHLKPFGASLGAALLALWPLSRMIGTRLLGRRESHRTWREIWTRRDEWRRGYPPAGG